MNSALRPAFAVAFAWALLAVPAAASAETDLVTQPVRFAFVGQDVIPGVAAVSATCEVEASAENVTLLSGESDLVSVSVGPGPCALALIVFGVAVPVPILNTTPLGKQSYYLPGIPVLTYGLVDVSLDLVSSMNATSRADDPGAVAVAPLNHSWSTWGARRLVLEASAGYGSRRATEIVTAFNWSVSLALTIWAVGVPLYSIGLTHLGDYPGMPVLRTGVIVDLLPAPRQLLTPEDITSGGVTLRWTGIPEDDLDHLELWIDDGRAKVVWMIEDPQALFVRVDARPGSSYSAWVVAVDEAGQSSGSNVVVFQTPAGSTDDGVQLSAEPTPWTVLITTILAAAVAAFVVGWFFGRRPR